MVYKKQVYLVLSFQNVFDIKKGSYYQANIEHVADLGFQLNFIRGKRVAKNENCQLDVNHKSLTGFERAQLKVIGVFCSSAPEKKRQTILFLDELLSSVDSYTGLTVKTLEQCEKNLERIVTSYNKTELKKVIYAFCKASQGLYRNSKELLYTPKVYHAWKKRKLD